SRNPGSSCAPAPHRSGRRSSMPRTRRLPLQLEDGLAQANGGTWLHGYCSGHSLIAQVGAVAGAEVFQVPAAVLGEDAGLPVGAVVVVEDEGGAGGSADEDRRTAQRQGGAVQWAGGDRQAARSAAFLATGGAGAAVGLLAHHTAVGEHPGAEHVP